MNMLKIVNSKISVMCCLTWCSQGPYISSSCAMQEEQGYVPPSGQKSSKYKGVSWHKHSQKWYAYIQYNGKMHGLGYFHVQEQAAAAYDSEARRVGHLLVNTLGNLHNDRSSVVCILQVYLYPCSASLAKLESEMLYC